MKTPKNKTEFLNVELKDISQVYEGKRNCCRCGCGGQYLSTSFNPSPRSPIDNEAVESALKRAKKHLEKKAHFDAGTTYFDVQTGINKTLTFYFEN